MAGGNGAHRNLVYPEPPIKENPEYDAIDHFLKPTEWTGPVKEKAWKNGLRFWQKTVAGTMDWAAGSS